MFTWADYVLIAIMAVSMLIGLWRGLVVEVLSLTVWVAAFWLSMLFGGSLAAVLDGVEQPAARQFLGYAGVFIGTLLLGAVVVWLIGKLITASGLSATDRLLGLVFGLVRGYALGCTLVLGLGFTDAPQGRWWRESRLLPGFVVGAEWMRGFLPAAASEQNHVGLET